MKDAFFGSIASAFNDYLDLGAGVMILWYGGVIAMDPNGSITVGQLITYQCARTQTCVLARTEACVLAHTDMRACSRT